MLRWSRAWVPGPPPQMWRRSLAWIPDPPLLMPRWSRALIFFPSHDGDKPPLEFVFPFLSILYFSSYNSDNPPLKFVCPFLYILYFPHKMATTLHGICLSASLHSLLSSHKGKNNPSYPLFFKNIKIIIMLIENTYWTYYKNPGSGRDSPILHLLSIDHRKGPSASSCRA
jgi:hypothetical protein